MSYVVVQCGVFKDNTKHTMKHLKVHLVTLSFDAETELTASKAAAMSASICYNADMSRPA